jgi:hypothetical protein
MENDSGLTFSERPEFTRWAGRWLTEYYPVLFACPEGSEILYSCSKIEIENKKYVSSFLM